MHSYIRPNTWAVIVLPSGILKPVEIIPNTIISIGKFGSFLSNSLIERPYHLTFEVQDKATDATLSELRVVSSTELQAEALLTEAHAFEDGPHAPHEDFASAEADVTLENDDGKSRVARNNQFTIDDATRQSLSMDEIDALKHADATDSGRAIVAKIMASHLALDEKTSFSLAKYTLRKERKYLKRFVVRPLDPSMLATLILDKEASRILELREEVLALVGAWSNAFYGADRQTVPNSDGLGLVGGGRWLVVDDTGGLVVAALAERMGILYPHQSGEDAECDSNRLNGEAPKQGELSAVNNNIQKDTDQEGPTDEQPLRPLQTTRKKPIAQAMTAKQNTITVLHTASQPSLGLLKYFGFDISAPQSDPPHPLHAHLQAISWLQLLEPSAESTYSTPIPTLEPTELSAMKSNKRGMYYHKKRRWERVTRVVDLTRAGGFDGLVVAVSGVADNATGADLADIFRFCVPLLRGGAQVVAYTPYLEQISVLTDLYSKERRSEWAVRAHKFEDGVQDSENDIDTTGPEEGSEDFPVNPSLLLFPSLQTVRSREWQALPGRMHPLMTERGGAEGYLFTATRILPAEGKVSARGAFHKRRKTDTTRDPVQQNGEP